MMKKITKQTVLHFLLVHTLAFLVNPVLAQNTWTVIANPAPDTSGSLMLLLSDGSVLCKTIKGGTDHIGNQWNRLKPDASGSYVNGSWSKVCPMRDTRLYFSSQTLKNGKVYLAGGEYGSGGNSGEVFDPLTNSWQQAPNASNYYGDACAALLPDGRVLQASLNSPGNKTLIYDPAANTYSNGPNCIGGHNESTWLKLQDNSILFVDIGSTSSERYIPALNQWVADANTPTNLYDPWGLETGPGLLLPDGRGFFIGSLGNTAFYTPSGNNTPGTWSSGPTVPNGHGMPDAPASLLVDGKIIFAAGPKPVGAGASSIFIAPTYFYEFDYLNNTFTQMNAPGGGLTVADTAFNSNMLTLPDGTVMYSELMKKNYYFYRPNGAPLAVGKPSITAVSQNGCSNTFTLAGLLFNGISEGTCYGDDWQMSTNFPIVRLSAGGNVYYARSYNWNHNGVRNFTNSDSTLFELPPNIPNGTYSLTVIANGISSDPITFTFAPFPSLLSDLLPPDICTGSSFTYAAVPNSTATNYSWTRSAVTGISNAAISSPQTTNPNEVLVNSSPNSKTAVYAYTLTNNTCTANYQVAVVVHPASNLTITSAANICAGKSATLIAKGASSYTWGTGAQGNFVIVNPPVSTTYSVEGIDYNNCPVNAQKIINVIPLPSLSLSGPTVICEGETAVITALGNGQNYFWPVLASSGNSVAVSPAVNTTYSVISTGINNCQKTDSLQLKVEACLGVTTFISPVSVLKTYPNPFTTEINIELINSVKKQCQLELKDIFGKTVLIQTVEFENGKYTLNVDRISNGFYLLTLRSDHVEYRTKMIKE